MLHGGDLVRTAELHSGAFLVPSPNVNPLVKVGPSEAWGIGTGTHPGPDGNSTLFHTVDGGAVWSPVVLPDLSRPSSAALLIEPPVFFSSTVGIVPTAYVDRPLVLDATDNGGRTWTAIVPPVAPPVGITAAQGFGSDGDVDLRSPTTWIVAAWPKIATASDGGKRWTTYTANPPWSHADVGAVAIATDDVWWAMVDDCNAKGCAGSYLVESSDEGRTWRAPAARGE